MTDCSIKLKVDHDLKNAMRAKEKKLVGTLRLVMAAFKQIEVDQRVQVDDPHALVILDKMLKQRKDSINQFEKAERFELADIEKYEVSIIEKYLPKPFTEQEVLSFIEQALEETGATEMKQMGHVMAILKPKLQGRTDMGQVSQLIKSKLSN